MNKKGDTTVWQELLKAIPSLIIFLLLVWAGVKIWNSTHPEQFSQERKDLMRLADELKDLDYVAGISKDTIAVPVLSKDHNIIAGKKTDSVISQFGTGCYKDYCLCFEKNSNTICEAFNLREEFGLEKKEDYKNVKLDVKPYTNTNNNVVLERTSKTLVTISN